MDHHVGNLLSFNDRKYLLISVENSHNMVPYFETPFLLPLFVNLKSIMSAR